MSYLSLADLERDALDALCEYARIPCLSPNYDGDWAQSGHLDRAVDLLADWARTRRLRDFAVEVHRLHGRTPCLTVTVEATGPGRGTTVLYGHLDKQPPLGEWSDGLSPYDPVRRDNRLYARGVADDGYSTFSALLALEALEARDIPHSRCVVLIEASEESASVDLEAYLDYLTPALGRVELMVCLDAGGSTYDRLWLTSSLRGIVNVELTVRVLERGVHSGSASGVVPSSFRILRRLLERVEDSSTGELLVDALRVEIPESARQSAKEFADEFGDAIADELPQLEGVQLMGATPEERILRRNWYPTLSVVGMSGIPETNIAGNVLRSSTTALLSFRLPPSVPLDVATDAIVDLLTRDVPYGAHVAFTTFPGEGWVAPPLAPWLATALDTASDDAFGRRPGFTGEGGSIPFLASLGHRYPDVQFVATGVLGPGSNAHGIDEMLDLDMMVGVTNAVATILGAYAAHSRDST